MKEEDYEEKDEEKEEEKEKKDEKKIEKKIEKKKPSIDNSKKEKEKEKDGIIGKTVKGIFSTVKGIENIAGVQETTKAMKDFIGNTGEKGKKILHDITSGQTGQKVKGIFENITSKLNLNQNQRRSWITKATNEQTALLNPVFVKKIITDIWETKNISPYLFFFRSLPIFSKNVVCYKALRLIHEISQNCDSNILKQMEDFISLITDIKETWNSDSQYDKNFAQLISEYSNFIINRIELLNRNEFIEPNFSTSKSLKSQNVEEFYGKKSPYTKKCCEELISLIEDLDKVQKLAFKDKTNECKTSSIYPLLMDSQVIYKLLLHILSKISSF
jgi:hypothetical protein